MRFYSLSILLDSIFVLITSFILFLFIFYYFTPYPYSIVLTFVLSGFATILASKFLSRKQNKIKLSEKDKKLYLDTLIRLNLMQEDRLIDLFKSALKLDYPPEIINENTFYDHQNNILYCVKFGFQKVTKTDIVRAFNKLSPNGKAIFYAESFEQDVINFSARFNKTFTLKDGKETFTLLKDSNLLPSEDYTEYYNEKKKPKIKAELFNKKSAKKFLLFGVAFLFFSFFAPIKTYYLVCGCVMMIFAIIIILFGKTKQAPN